MIKTMVMTAVLMVTGAAMGQTATDSRIAQSLTLNAQAAMIHSEYPEAAMALSAHAAQILTAPPMPEVALFVDARLVDGCKDGILAVCDILIETPGNDHAKHVADFLFGSCAGDSADAKEACSISDAIRAEIAKRQ